MVERQIVTKGIVLSRTDYGEADRIITILTPDHGKLRLMAKGVRKSKSKLAGGIELFSVSDITFIRGRGEIGTLVSTRLRQHYGTIVKDIQRTMLGYEIIKQLDRATEDEPGEEYFDLLAQAFEALNSPEVSSELVQLWLGAQLLRYGGHAPNLRTDVSGQKLAADKTYLFSFDDMAFVARPDAPFAADHIKLLRICFSDTKPVVVQKIDRIETLLQESLQLVKTMLGQYIRA